MRDIPRDEQLENEKLAQENYAKEQVTASKPEVFEASKKLDKRQLKVARRLYKSFKYFRMMGGDLSKNEKLWNSKAVHELKKMGIRESEFPVFIPIADYIRKLVINPIVPDNASV